MRSKKKVLGGLIASIAMASSVPIVANAADAKESKLSIIEEVLVSARKREENLQEVPIAITALGAEELRQKGISKPDDLQMHTPGLEIRTAGLQRNNLQFFLRGQGQTFGSTPGVIIYFSEAQLGNSPKVSIGNNGQFFDLASVQVLKGPQGTLFGRSTTGGAVLFDPQHPTDEFGGFIQATAGDYGTEEYTGAVTIPLVEGKLSTRLAANITRRDGFTESLTTGQIFDDRHRESYRLGISFTPTEWLDTYTLFQHNEVDENNTGTVLLDFNENNPLYNTTPMAGAGWFGIAAPPLPIPGLEAGGLCYNLNIGSPAGYASCSSTRLGLMDDLRNGLIAEEARVKSGGDDAKRYNTTGGELVYKGRNEQLLNITKVDLGDMGFLGEVSLKNVFNSVRKLGVHTKYDSGSPIPNGLVYNNYTLRGFEPVATDSSRGRNDWFDDFSEEFQILGTVNEKHSWIVGVYYEEDYDEISSPPLFTAFANVFTPHPVLYPSVVGAYRYDSLKKDTGYFAQTTLDLSDSITEGLNLTLGYRWSETKVTGKTRGYDATELALNGNIIPGSTVSPTDGVDDSAPSWNISVDYQWNDDTLVYVAHRRGFKPGGTNVSPPQGAVVPGFNTTYDPETVDDIELGVKADWELFGRPVRTNAAGYMTWYDDIQRSETLSLNGTPFTQTANIAEAEIFGMELSAQYQVADRLLLSLNYSYIDAKYTNWPGTVTNILTGNVLNLEDSPYVGAPENQGTISLQYLLPTPIEWGEISFSADYFMQSAVHLNDTELADGFGKEDGYENLNLRLSWENISGHPVDLAVFVNNATDDIHAVSQNSFYSVNGTANAVYSEPRIWGAELRYRFGSDK